jgi:hypothetical protein
MVSATLLKAAGAIDTIKIVRVSDIVNNKVEITNQDIVCNLPYQPEAHLWFDHHSSEIKKQPAIPPDFRGGFALAPSTAGVVYKYYLTSHPELERFAELVRDTDILDSADVTKEDVLHPEGNIKLGLLLDPRTRLADEPGLHEEYIAWKLTLPELFQKHTTEEILALPETQRWLKRYEDCQEEAINILLANSYLDGNVIISDFRGKKLAPVNRFILYSLPGLAEGNISVQIADGEPDVWYEVAVGHSVFNRTSMMDVGDLCAWYGGGGHRTVGVCRPSVEDAEEVIKEVIGACKERVTA